MHGEPLCLIVQKFPEYEPNRLLARVIRSSIATNFIAQRLNFSTVRYLSGIWAVMIQPSIGSRPAGKP